MMNRERLQSGLLRMGIEADALALDRFEAFHAILDEYNRRMDLTAEIYYLCLLSYRFYIALGVS